MPSPFPGMDPYLESPSIWLDFHSRFVNAWCESIADVLPEQYEAGLGERVYLIDVEPESRKLVFPDIAVTGTEGDSRRQSTQAIATLEPVTIPLEMIEGPRESFIEILHRPDQTLVTVLELLSPANKQPPGRTEYLSKRASLLRQPVHLVELDLLAGGQRLPMQRPLPVGDCYYFLARAEQRPDCQVFAWALPNVLPRVPVPLLAPDGDLTINLGQVFATAYDRGRFRRRLTYGDPCPVPLPDEQQTWVNRIVASLSTS